MNKKLGIIAFILFLMSAAAGAYLFLEIRKSNQTSPYYLANDEQYVTVVTKEGETLELPRGTMVEIRNKEVTIDDIAYREFVYNDTLYYVTDRYLC